MAQGAYGRSRGFTSFGGDTEGGVPDLTGLTSGYGQGIAREFNFIPQMQQQGATDYDIMTKLYAEQQAKQAADQAAMQKLTGEPFTIDALTEDMGAAQVAQQEFSKIRSDYLQNPDFRAWVNVTQSAKPSQFQLTPAQVKAGADFMAQTDKYKQMALRAKALKDRAEAYQKLKGVNSLAEDQSIEDQIRAEKLITPEERFGRQIGATTEKADLYKDIKDNLLDISVKTAKKTSEFIEAFRKGSKGESIPEKGTSAWFALEEIVRTADGNAETTLSNYWEDPKYLPNVREDVYKKMEANPKLTYDEARAEAKKEFIENHKRELMINTQTKSGLHANDFALIHARLRADKELKKRIYVQNTETLNVGGNMINSTVYKPTEQIKQNYGKQFLPEGSIKLDNNEEITGNVYSSETGNGRVFYRDKKTRKLVPQNLISSYKPEDLQAQGYQEVAAINQQDIDNFMKINGIDVSKTTYTVSSGDITFKTQNEDDKTVPLATIGGSVVLVPMVKKAFERHFSGSNINDMGETGTEFGYGQPGSIGALDVKPGDVNIGIPYPPPLNTEYPATFPGAGPAKFPVEGVGTDGKKPKWRYENGVRVYN